MGLSILLKKIVYTSLLGAAIVLAAVTVAKGVEVVTMFGTTCISGGCIAVGAGNKGGWFGIVFGLLSYLYAGGIQSGRITSGLSKRSLYSLEEITNGTFLTDNLLHSGFEANDIESLVAAVVHGASGFTLQGTQYTVTHPRDGKVQIATKHTSSKRDDAEYQAYTDQEVDLSYMDQGAMNDWANDIASSILSNFGGNDAVCAQIEEQSEQGGYAFAGLQISQAGSDMQNDGSCDYANYDKRDSLVKVLRRHALRR